MCLEVTHVFTAFNPPTQQFSTMSLNPAETLAVDGSPLQMDRPLAPPRPDPRPSNKVDSSVFQTIRESLQGSNSEAEFPLRIALAPSNTSVYTNHFAIKLDPKTPLYEYKISGLPPKIAKRTSRILVLDAIDKTPFLRDNQNKFATDYNRLISWVKIPDLGAILVQSVDWKPQIAITLDWVGQVDTELMQKYSEGKVEPTKEVEMQIKLVSNALNMIVSTVLGKGSFSLKANKFFVTGGHNDLGPSLCAIRGYYYSILPAMGQILLRLNGCTSAFYKPILVSDFLNDDRTFGDEQQRLSQLQGLRVQLMYDPVYNGKVPRSKAATIEARIKTIAGHGRQVSQENFLLKGKDGQPEVSTTVQAHFEKTYNVKAQNSSMPAINCGTTDRPKWYLPEKLQILPYQLYKKLVPEHLTSAMLAVALHHPTATRALIEHEGLVKLGLAAGKGLTPFSACPAIQIDSRMLQIPATTLPYPRPVYSNGTVDMRASNWNLANRKLLQTNRKANFKIFIIAVPRNGRRSVFTDPQFIDSTWGGFQQAMQSTYGTAKIQSVGQVLSYDFEKNPGAPIQCMNMAKAKGANFVMLFLEAKSTFAYSAFKELADRKFGMHSSCIVGDNPRRFSHQYWGNIALKINLKAGGINHTVTGIETIMKDTLVLGADVTHPQSNSVPGTPSIAAVVGSVTSNGGKFLGSMRLQPRITACEEIQDLESMVLDRLKAWFLNNGRALPKNIIYYRDGVSDSQYSQIKDGELPQIRKAFLAAGNMAGLKQAPKFKLTAWVVAKRHNVKMFAMPNDADPRNGNCRPGTMVDTAITSPYFKDYYLQSHSGIKGTAKSAHYFPLTHKLCYVYVRATMGVSYASPAYYADRLCDRGRCYIRDFLAPGPNSPRNNEAKDMKKKLKKEARTAREAKYKSRRTLKVIDGRSITVRSDEEVEQEKKDELDVEEKVKAEVFRKAKSTFYGGEIERDPWHSNIADTMFWM
ncbi:ribonuclease H-like domain-containing protein [Ampelomyces quisqualis]|uniref:Ribonuclease H-like domain-containing protein n=1 Tax=Ampelomyces quisqualis TaxID=50730 RepID=A0A6A5QUX7_AMPQU|nr:ribonuclease H-like domain-containing protein [Ampelomyces quisqualis]